MITMTTMSLPDATIGRLWCNGFQCFTLERPWIDNRSNISCIPSGQYEYFFRQSPTNGAVLELKGVPDRSYIQIHKGNYVHQIAGCILVGESIAHFDGDGRCDVTNSTRTLSKLIAKAGETGVIKINGYGREFTVPK